MKLAFIISNVDYAISYERVSKGLIGDGYDLSFIFLNSKPPSLYYSLKRKGVNCKYIKYQRKFPDLLLAIIKIAAFLLVNRIEVVHTHLMEASLVGLLSARLTGIKKRVYTRHYSTYHHSYYPQAVKYDKLINILATDFVAISENVKNVLEKVEGVNNEKIHLIEHAFDFDYFKNVKQENVDLIYKKYNLDKGKVYIGVISRYEILKGHKYIIEAFKSVYNQNPNLHLLLVNASGPDHNQIKLELDDLIKGSFTEVAFEKELAALYKVFDVFVHVPIDGTIEAFGQTYVEALSSGVPSIFTLSGIAHTFIENNENALVVDYKKSDQIASGIERILTDQNLRLKLKKNGKKSIERFNLGLHIEKLKKIYE